LSKKLNKDVLCIMRIVTFCRNAVSGSYQSYVDLLSNSDSDDDADIQAAIQQSLTETR